MSLIQEALRRQQQELEAENSGKEVPTEMPSTEAETPPADNQQPEELVPAPADTQQKPLGILRKSETPPEDVSNTASEDQDEEWSEEPESEAPVRRNVATKQRIFIPLIGVLLVLALLGAVVVWAVLYGFKMFTAEPSAPAKTTAVEAPQATPVERDPDPSPAEASMMDTAEAPQPDVPAVTPPPEDAVQPGTIEKKDMPPQITTLPPPAKDTGAQATVTDAQPEPPEPIIWPDVHVSGVMGAGNGGSAIINGKVYSLNDKVDEMTVRGFGRGYVVLEYQGEQRQISIGRSIR